MDKGEELGSDGTVYRSDFDPSFLGRNQRCCKDRSRTDLTVVLEQRWSYLQLRFRSYH